MATLTAEEIQERVEERLRKQQENKEFQDTEKRVGGSRKEKAAYKMILLTDLDKLEEDEVTAYELVRKDKVYEKVDVDAEMEKGTSSGATFLKVKLREAFPNMPAVNQKEYRKMYVGYADYIIKKFADVVDVKDFKEKASEVTEEVIRTFVGILKPDLIQLIEEELSEEKRINDKNKKILAELENKRDKLLVEYVKKYPDSESKYVNSLNEDALSEYDRVKWSNIVSEVYEAEKNVTYSKHDVTQIESDFLVGLGLSRGRVSSSSYIGYRLITEVFSKRFANFLTRSQSASATYEQAVKYEPFTSEDSKLCFENNVESRQKQLIEEENEVKFLKEPPKPHSEYDAFFKEKGRGSIGFSGGDFHITRKKFTYWADVNSKELFEAYVKRYIMYVEKGIAATKEKIEFWKGECKVRENDWSWHGKKKGKKEEKDKPVLTINEGKPLAYIKRTGGVKVVDDNISVEFMQNHFGFKTIEFGKYMKDTESREHIRHFIAAMVDMYDILDWDIKFVNQLGGLSMAFGSRGKGKAMAHYEPMKRIINISKKRGDGTVAHEYTHYLDHLVREKTSSNYDMFAEVKRYLSHVKSGRYFDTSVSEKPEIYEALKKIFEFIYSGRRENQDDAKEHDVTITVKTTPDQKSYALPRIEEGEEIDAYWIRMKNRYWHFGSFERIGRKETAIMRDIVKKFGFTKYDFPVKTRQSRFYAMSSMLSNYWTKPHELFARGFETYIYDKLAKSGRVNNYLVSGDDFDHEAGVYPQGEEREILFELYDNLMTAIKTGLDIPDFKAWTTERVDEYIDLEEKPVEEVNTGIIVNEKTDKIIAKVGDVESIQKKLETLAEMLGSKMEKGGEISTKLIEYFNYN